MRFVTDRVKALSLLFRGDDVSARVAARADSTQGYTMRHNGWRTTLPPLLISAVLVVVGAEAAARIFWRLCYGIPIGHPDRILYAYYPAIREVDKVQPAHGDRFYDILFLGGSVLDSEWGQVEQSLREQLAYAGQRNVRIFNLARPAHTSRDSWLKYAALSEARFDLRSERLGQQARFFQRFRAVGREYVGRRADGRDQIARAAFGLQFAQAFADHVCLFPVVGHDHDWREEAAPGRVHLLTEVALARGERITAS